MNQWLFLRIQKGLLAGVMLFSFSTACTKKSSSSKTDAAQDSSSVLEKAGVAAGFITSGYSGVAKGLGLVDTNSCDSGSYSIFGLGHDTAFSSGTFSGAAFSDVSAPTGDAIMRLTCADGSTQSCLVKAGDSGVICNQIANAIVGAFESALGKPLTDASFRGAAVAKVASSIVAAALISSAENDALVADLQACKTDADAKACAVAAIGRSPFFDAFKIMQQLSVGWNAEGLFLFVTGVLGKNIYLDKELYGSIFNTLAESRGDGFIESIRDLIAKVVISQKAADGKYAFAIKCAVAINNDSKYFDPDLNDSSELTCNKEQLEEMLTSAGIASTHFATIEAGELHDPVPCDAQPQQGCWADLSMIVTALSTEPDRNDIDGTHSSDRGGSNERGVSLIDVMPQVMIDIQDAQLPIGDKSDHELTADEQVKFKEIMDRSQKYFLGLLGVYQFLNQTGTSAPKLSLNDIHELFVGKSFIRSRLTSWGPGLTGVQAGEGNHNAWTSPLLTPTDNLHEFSVDSAFIFQMGAGGGGFNQPTITTDQFNTLFDASTPRFSDTFEMFTKIPTAEEISDFVYNSSHHEEWNPMGSQYISVAEFAATDKPIACAMTNAGVGQSLVAGTVVSCDTDPSAVTCDADGLCTFPDDYAFPYVLMERGWYGDDQGRLFALTGRKTGLALNSNGGQGVMIKEYKSGNPAGKCDADQVGSVISYIEEFYCGPNVKCQQKSTAFCMDMSAFGTPSRKRFYPGGQVTVSNQSSDGQKWEWQVPLIGAYNGTDHSKDTSVCLHVPTDTFVDASTKSSVATSHVNSTTGALTLAGVTGAEIKECSEDADSGFVKYYVYNWGDFAGSETMYAWLLDASDKYTVQFKNGTDGVNDQWQTTYATLSKTEIESLLSGKTIAGSAATQINSMRYHNPRHDPKFDPYCDDLDDDGFCGCYPLETLSADGQTATFGTTMRTDPSQCGLLDKAAEPTISELPYCAQCPNAGDAKDFFEEFGAKSGADLIGVKTYFQTKQPSFNINAAVFCQFKFADQSKPGQPKWIDWGHWEQSTHPGCPAVEGDARTDDAQGPIRIINPRPMRNAFNVARPNTMIKLINYATKSVGQGVTLDPATKVFSMDEAMALVQFRNLMPPDQVTVFGPDGAKIDGIAPAFQSISSLDKDSDAFSSMLKGIMFKAGLYTQEEIDVVAPEHDE